MDDLIAFINARLAEWERMAQQALPLQTGSRDEGQPVEHVSWRRGAGHPQFALHHVAALRAIVAAYAEVARMDIADPEPEFACGRAVGLGEAVRQLAASWNLHPGYRQEWAP